jgi:hypothetical protein
MIAHHEAGHAVIARVLGIGVTHVTRFLAVAQTRSATWLALDADTPTLLAAMEKDAKVSFAGPIAQQKHRYRKGADKNWSADLDYIMLLTMKSVMLRRDGIRPSSDNIEYTLDDAAHAEADALWERLNEETNALVNENWAAIERVANALLDCPLLTQDALDALIAGTEDQHAAKAKAKPLRRLGVPIYSGVAGITADGSKRFYWFATEDFDYYRAVVDMEPTELMATGELHGPFDTAEEADAAARIAINGEQCEYRHGGQRDPAWSKPQ